MNNKVSNLYLFKTLFVINLLTFGGGYTIMPIIKDEFVNKKKCIDDEEMNDILTMAQSIPGIMTVSTCFLTGYKINGFIGAFISVLASVLPCFLVISVVFVSYTYLIENIYIKNTLSGISGAISALLLLSIISMIKARLKSNKKLFYITIMILSFIANYILKISIVYIILTCAILGYLYNRGDDK